MNIGEIYKTANWGKIKILDFQKGKSKILIQFLNSKNTYLVEKIQIEKGCIEDYIEKENILLKKEFPQNCGDILRILYKEKEYNHHYKEYYYRVKFKINNYETFASLRDIKIGSVNNPYVPNICGVGFIGEEKYNYNINKFIYSKWLDMIHRCYDYKRERYSVYGEKGVTVCEEWHNFSNYLKWIKENSIWNTNNYDLMCDKDILANVNHLENKIYSPETCLLIPDKINLFLVGDKYSGGVENRKGRFRAICKGKYLGTFNSFSEAKQVYAEEKYKIWVDLINKYLIPNNLKEILLKYDFNWSWIN